MTYVYSGDTDPLARHDRCDVPRFAYSNQIKPHAIAQCSICKTYWEFRYFSADDNGYSDGWAWRRIYWWNRRARRRIKDLT